MKRYKVLVIDDSALIRKLLSEMLQSSDQLEVVGTAGDPFVARTKIKDLDPDVLTLDVEMPRMDGLTFLGNLMRLRPLPVIMVSSLTEKGADVTLRALELGAFDFVSKPKLDVSHTLSCSTDELVQKVLAAARHRSQIAERAASRSGPGNAPKTLPSPTYRTTDQILAIGASTGGTEAIRDVLSAMPAGAPGIVITQHIPESFSGPFARRLDQCSALSVSEARDGQPVLAGHAYVAPGNRHLEVVRSGAKYFIRLSDAERVNRHKPSVDVMFDSLVTAAGRNVVASLLTGMGADGAQGLLRLRNAGAQTIAQDESTSVIYGMPREAAKIEAAAEILPLDRIAARMLHLADTESPQRSRSA